MSPYVERACGSRQALQAQSWRSLSRPSPIGMWIGIAAGLMFAVTGLVGFCPMCAMVGRKPVEARE